MLEAAQLRAVLARLPALSRISGYWARAIADEYLSGPPPSERGGPQPLWAHGPPRYGARYTPKGGAPALYLADPAELALLEVEAIAAVGGRQRLTGKGPMVLLTVDVCVRDVLDVCDPTVQSELGTNMQELTASWRLAPSAPTQRLGDLVANAGRFDALLAPSSKLAEGRVLVVFTERLSESRGTYCSIVQGGRLAQRIP